MRIQRRDLLLTAAAIGLGGTMAGAASRPAKAALATDDGYFLSPRNPVANRDQRDLETMAIALMARPDVQAAMRRISGEWARVTDHSVSPELWAMFPDHIASYCFRSILLAVNSDANYPKVLRIYSPAGKWLGHDVPASKWGAENPDNAYRIIPVRPDGRYVVHGQRQANPPSHVSYVLVSDTDTSITEGLLEQQNMEIAPDGSFTLTLDASPVAGRRNHIQLTPECLYLFMRDSMGDWRQTPNALRVERLNPPSRAPLTMDELAARAARVMHTGVAPEIYWLRLVLNIPMGTMAEPQLTGASGGLLTQLSSPGWFRLADDDAVIVRTNVLDAAYHSFVGYDLWNRSLEYRDHQTSLNNATIAADADGRHTFVVSHRDPGVQNWIDTTGLHELSVSFRWQGISPSNAVKPDIQVRTVKLSDLASTLPQGVPKVSPEQRTRQLEQRRTLFDRRFIDS